jgi:predicted RNA binding protein YcfA (HicA-like mRNA interferase family)
MVKLFEKNGFELVKGGKGSHRKLRKGNITVIVPDHRELKGLEMALRKQLKDS